MKQSWERGFTALVAGALIGCGARSESRAYEYMPDMARSRAYQAYAPNDVTRNGLTLQPPVPGTIPRGYQPLYFREGDEQAGSELRNPYLPDAQVLADGKALYETYCAVCHGATGRGDGPIAGKIPPPPAYTSDRIRQFPPGRLFYVITMGTGKMPPYAAQLSSDERWKIVTYVQSVLQRSGGTR